MTRGLIMQSMISRHHLLPTRAKRSSTFIDMIKDELGETKIKQLDQDIVKRFMPTAHSNQLRYIGVVDWIYCSLLGKIIARFLKPLALLPDQCTRDRQFEFTIQQSSKGICKQRRYHLGASMPFTFRSSFSNEPCLHEEFKAGFGMKLKLLVKQGNLLFRDQGYFWRFGQWRLPIPKWCTVGHFELLHRNINQQRFQVIIRIYHPIFGTLFYQRGEFQQI